MVLLSLPLPTELDRLAARTARPKLRRHGKLAVGFAALCHAAVICLLLRLAEHRVAGAPDPAGFALVLASPAPEQASPLVEAASPPATTPAQPAASPFRAIAPATALTVVKHVAAAKPAAARAPRIGEAPRRAVPPHHSSPAGNAATETAQAASQPAIAAPQAPDPGPGLAILESKIDQAVRNAAVMPGAAIRQHREGRAQLRFTYVDGSVDGVAVVQSSQSRVLDDAAVSAVRRATYPMPPALLRGRHLPLLVWIDFKLQASPG